MELEYKIRRSQRARKMQISIDQKGEVVLVLPRFIPEWIGRNFVIQNQHWISKKKQKISFTLPDQKAWKSGDELVFFDQKFYTIKVLKPTKKSQFETVFQALHIYADTQGDINYQIERFYRQQAQKYLTSRSHYFAAILGVDFNRITIKNTKSRWGSCSSKKNLNYNWRIMMAPREVIDYLVVHEVCHLKEMNHSQAFWNLVAGLDSDFKTHKKWLRENQNKLLNFLL